MVRTELNRYKQILEARWAELAQVLHQRDAIAIETSADSLDEAQQAAEHALTIANLDRQSDLLRNVRAAIDRIENGTFGICIHCEQEISPKRLAALPWAPYCITCQKAADEHEEDLTEVTEIVNDWLDGAV